jgi:hypothetical protein
LRQSLQVTAPRLPNDAALAGRGRLHVRGGEPEAAADPQVCLADPRR